MNQLLNLTTMSKLTQKKIRAYAGVKRNTQLPALLEGRPTIDQSLGVVGERYNNEIKQKRKQKHNEAQAKYVKRKKAIEKLKKLKIVEKIRELLKAQSEEVAAILTPEQREKFKQTRNATPSAEDRLQRMTTALSLTTEQQAKVKAIMDNRGQKLRELMAKGRDNASEADKEQFKELMKQQFEEIGAVLTPDQKTKFKEIRDQRGPAKPAEKASN